ncbi:hypothetical protein EWM64_g9039 [Hericium alpestre]|uniref:Adenylate kinase isoenzyme 6 homolog n=1 Tax=Hericium alpestre TaxID=135208 RepID=A0A4Y9ZJR5_9AGAM|nr:hypothetical protein EWM64_g9039 [Hericium alpestre]
MSDSTSRKSPIIVITGTPGTGKSTHAQLLAEESPVPLQHINVGEWVKEKGLHEGYDEEWQSYTVDEDKVRARAARMHAGYPLKKIQENNEAEIMDVVIDEARASYAEPIVVELKSEGMEDLQSNVARIVQWIEAWQKDRGLAA